VRFLALALVPFFLRLALSPATAGENVLVIGDSLSKEYETEFKGLYPDRPDAWDARNWNEILDARRNDAFDLGSWGIYADFRLTGHTFNCAKPGGTAREFRNFLRQDEAAEEEITGSSGGGLVWPFFPTWRDTFNDLLADAEKVVIFYGGNDLALGNSDPLANPEYNGQPKQIDYESIYDGRFGEASNPDLLRDSIRKNLRSIVQYLRVPPSGQSRPRFAGPIVLVNAPHVGCTPKVIGDTGTDETRHARCTAMIERLNGELRALADEFDLGYADVYALTDQIRRPGDFTIGGIRFSRAPDPDCGPRALFSGDGFHPNTPAQAKMAQIILQAFRTKYPATTVNTPPLSDREIIEGVLGLPRDTGFKEWLTENNVPSNRRDPLSDPDLDGVPNLLEFALAGRNPMSPTDPPLPSPILESTATGTTLRLDYTPRFPSNVYCRLTPRHSKDLVSWTDVPASHVTRNPDGTTTIRQPIDPASPLFLQFVAVVEP
jgi:lysophospholipase L1-like esterase